MIIDNYSNINQIIAENSYSSIFLLLDTNTDDHCLDLFIKKSNIKVISFDSLTTDLCKKLKSTVILRGLRAVSDFEYEFQLSGMNKKLNNSIETLFLMSDADKQIISSKLIKEITELRGDIKKFTTKSTVKALKDKYA